MNDESVWSHVYGWYKCVSDALQFLGYTSFQKDTLAGTKPQQDLMLT